MKSFLSFLAFIILINIGLIASAQVPYDSTDFLPPVKINMVLAGNFAEMRSNHFHTGLDIKTNGKEGYRIYAIDTGYVSRINISHWGYGKAMYVTHPNGYTSVYAHLSKFPKKIEQIIRNRQFSEEKETLTMYFSKGKIPVERGEVIAYSGNSGSSSAPHLHFEIRETETEKPVNPLLFDFDISDTKQPVLLDVKLYTLSGGLINDVALPYNMDLSGSSGNYKRKYTAPVKVNGPFGTAINTIDYLDGAGNKCGIYTIELFVDGNLHFRQKLEKLEFNKNRYINTHSDYLEYRLHKQSYHKTFKSTNNKLDIYEYIKDDGVILFKDSNDHTLKYIVSDVYGNTSEVEIEVSSEYNPAALVKEDLGDKIIVTNKRNIVETDGFQAIIPPNSVYENLKYEVKELEKKHANSPLYQFNDDHIPIHKYFVLKLKMTDVPAEHQEKALIVELSRDQRRLYAKGGETKDDWLQTEVRSFGNYMIKLDTVAPLVIPNGFTDGQMVTSGKISFNISDNLSGIENYDVWVDGKWKLANYLPKKGILTLHFDNYNDIPKGNHTLKIKVADERKNQTTKTYSFKT